MLGPQAPDCKAEQHAFKQIGGFYKKQEILQCLGFVQKLLLS